jgi:hypothetical protein
MKSLQNNPFMKSSIIMISCAVWLGFTSSGFAARGNQPMPNPDFTKGGKIPEGARHDWNLGATGARGWMYSNRLETSQARQIAITQVAKGSPADGILQPGDAILGLSGKPFSADPRVAFGKALTTAEAESGDLTVTRWRDGTTGEVVIKLPVLGSYSATAPYDCKKSAKIFEQGCKSLAARMQTPDHPKSKNAITRSLNALALLASGNPDYLPLIRREVEWADSFASDGFQTWWNAYVIMLLAEYKLATGDDTFTSGMQRLALEAAKGQSMVGSWGHRYALPSGNLTGYGMMNAPGVPLTISLIMARQAGLKDPAIDLAIDRSAKLLRFYIGKGAVPYGDHAPWTQTHEDNGKCGMAGVMFNLLGEKDGAEFFSRMSTASHGPERDTGHTGNFTNMTWAMPGVALAGPHATGAWMKEFGAWHYDLTRTWDFQFPHPGPPEPNGDHFRGWDATGAYLLAYSMPLKKILLTGKQPFIAPQIDAATAQSLILDGRGWSNNDRTSAYDALNPDDLLEKLGSWSPSIRERAAMALARRKGDKPVAALVAMLDSPNLYARYGACDTLGLLREAAAPAVPKLTGLLEHDDLWLRIKAAETLAHIGPPAMSTLPVLLERLIQGPTGIDPRGMEQRYLCSTVFSVMLKNSLDGVDRDLLRKAIAAGLQNEDGRARSSLSDIYQKLTFEELKPILPAIHEAIRTPSPSGEMFADGIRLAGIELFARHRIAEGMATCVDYIENQNKWASEKRIHKLIELLLTYGAHAQAFIPQLEKTAASFDAGEENFPGHLSKQKAAALRQAIQSIQASTERPALIQLK